MKNITKRILSSIVLLGIFFCALFLGYTSLMVLFVVASIIMFWEYVSVVAFSGESKTIFVKSLWVVAGAIYIILPIPVANVFFHGYNIIAEFLFIMFIVWSTDTGAYVIGKIFGGRKLAPKISPGKTISGAIGGIITAIVVMSFYPLLFHNSAKDMYISIILLSIACQMGDLLASWVKRKHNVKDYSNIIPGHGGLLDRLDGTLAALWLFPILDSTII